MIDEEDDEYRKLSINAAIGLNIIFLIFIGFVRDLLLSNHNRGGRSKNKSSSYSSTTSSYLVTPHKLTPAGLRNEEEGGISNSAYTNDFDYDDELSENHNYPVIKIIDGKFAVVQVPPRQGIGSSNPNPSKIVTNKVKEKPSWKLLRVQPQITQQQQHQQQLQQQQQVYVKANDHLLPTTTTVTIHNNNNTESTRSNTNTRNTAVYRNRNNNTTTTANHNEDAEAIVDGGDEGQDQVTATKNIHI